MARAIGVMLALVGILSSRPIVAAAGGPSPLMGFRAEAKRPRILFLSWDTEGGPRVGTNLLRAGTGVGLRFLVGEQWTEAPSALATSREDAAIYEFGVVDDAVATWQVRRRGAMLSLCLTVRGSSAGRIKAAEIVFPFDPRVTPTTVLPTRWQADGTLLLPAVVSAPDFGQMLLRETAARPVTGQLLGSRKHKTVDLTLRLDPLEANRPFSLELAPIVLPPPEGLRSADLWRQARRGWLNCIQPTAEWGDKGNPHSAPAGMLGNNVVSDPASCSLWFYADQAFWTPRIAPEISLAPLVRRTLDWWLDNKIRPTGEMICYWSYGGFLDANSGPIIAAWTYFETTADRRWLAARIERLELLAEFLAKRDVDGDGMIEATQSGNFGTLVQPNRSCSWFDALNVGHKDGLTNAIAYRAWRCLADLEHRLGRAGQRARYTKLADRLKAAYRGTLFNPKTGWLGMWRSADGELHDYASPVWNGIAIEYDLVDPAEGREILSRLRTKMTEVGFKRFDLGVPPMLIPVRRGDYLLPNACGIPQKEDGTDTFGYYMNGGITAGQVLHFLAAHYVVGDPAPADRILRAMLDRQQRGEFQNGVTDAYPKGIDWTTWDGKPSGYEGYLADSFRFLQAALLRELAFRDRFYRPLNPS